VKYARRVELTNSYVGQAPEIQSMYGLSIPASALRTKMRHEFERHRYVKEIRVVDVLLFQSHAEFQVRQLLFNFHWCLLAGEKCPKGKYGCPPLLEK
jgi:hypothetical protein